MLVAHDLPAAYYTFLDGRDDVVLLETSRYDADNYRSFLFVDPIDTRRADSLDEIPALLADIERYLDQDCYVAGYVGYECGYHFEKIADAQPGASPLAWFGIYRAPLVFNHLTGTCQVEGETVPAPVAADLGSHDYAIAGLRYNIPAEAYLQRIETIKDLIRSGWTYQINFTGKYVFTFRGSPLALYGALKRRQRVSYGAFIRAQGRTVLSLSPELFFRRSGDTLVTRPMKGTVRRGRTGEEDLVLEEWLRNDPKNRAENVMIVDLLRNDVGRIAETGSVQVRELFAVERYLTLFQMTSTVEGALRPGVGYYDIFRSLFPCGSVTGAPKIRSMQIIRELEGDARGIYTGAIGYFSPAREAVFNVAIRTLVINGHRGEMGVGSGIVADSDPHDEYRECQLKADFLTVPYEEFKLVETILWNQGYPLLSRHMRRLAASAAYFDYPCDVDRVVKELTAHSERFVSGNEYKVRMTLDRHGDISVESWVMDESRPAGPGRVALSGVRMNSTDRFLYHKTTRRQVYEEMSRVARERGFVEVLFLNEEGHLTEGAISNVFIRKGDALITPPLVCGLLDGVYRQHLLATEPRAREGVVSLGDLKGADGIYICNAIRGLREVTLSEGFLDPLRDDAGAGEPSAQGVSVRGPGRG
jgi:para-aminobenzoate synthetase/4-amino-4-deoxychorismate lyase